MRHGDSSCTQGDECSQTDFRLSYGCVRAGVKDDRADDPTTAQAIDGLDNRPAIRLAKLKSAQESPNDTRLHVSPGFADRASCAQRVGIPARESSATGRAWPFERCDRAKRDSGPSLGPPLVHLVARVPR